MPYGQQWRNHQRLQASYLNVSVSKTYTPLQDLESKQMIFELLSGVDFAAAFHRYSSSTIYALAYGKRLEQAHMKEAEEIEQIMVGFLGAARVGTWLVDAIPALRYLPAWLAPFKRYGEKLHSFEAKVYARNLEEGQRRTGWNWSKHVMSIKEGQVMPALELAYDVGITYEAGSDTTTMAMEVFTMAAVLYDFLPRAQKELDEVVGHARMPAFADLDRLPFVAAVVNEVLRWRPVTAGGIPHAVTKDDEYMGYHIPAGATVIGNHWSIHLDEEIYEDAMSFKPERWIEDPDLPLNAFGFGRRVCTGQHIARNSLLINISRMMWAFNINHKYENGLKQDIDPLAMTQGFNSRPMPFKASFTVRSPQIQATIQEEWQSAVKDGNVVLEGIRAAQTKKSST